MTEIVNEYKYNDRSENGMGRVHVVDYDDGTQRISVENAYYSSPISPYIQMSARNVSLDDWVAIWQAVNGLLI